MNLKVKHQFAENTLRGEVTPETKSGVTDGLLKANSAVAVSRVGARVATCILAATALGGIILAGWLVVTRAFLLVGSRLLLGSLQIHGILAGLLSLERSSLGSTTCHGLELSLADQVLEVNTWGEDNVHSLDVVGRELLHRLGTLAGK